MTEDATKEENEIAIEISNKELLEMTDFWELARRYFVTNFFDGIMTVLGVVLGLNAIGNADPVSVIKTGLMPTFALALSGFWSVFFAEKAERRRKMAEMRRALLIKEGAYNNTIQERANKIATILNSFVDSISPLLAGILGMSPFIIGLFIPLDGLIMVIASLVISLVLLFFIGVFIARISDMNPWRMAITMTSVGVLLALLSTFIETI